jgi:phosphoglycolate/pyridoxal phosphate phosphatase family enzyme
MTKDISPLQRGTSPDRIEALILDMDGVLWQGPEPIGDLPAIFDQMKNAGFEVILATNNSTSVVGSFLQKLSSLGVDLERWQIITSAEATAAYLDGRFPSGTPVYVVGEEGLERTLQEHGFSISSDGALAVVVGLDRKFTYRKMETAMKLVEGGAVLLGTNPDKTLPTPNGLVPGAGSMIAAIEAATGETARIIGKPQPEMFQQALVRLGVDAGKTLVVGDRLETDIAGGQSVGCQTAILLSGVAKADDISQWVPPPTFIADDLTQLITTIKSKSQ